MALSHVFLLASQSAAVRTFGHEHECDNYMYSQVTVNAYVTTQLRLSRNDQTKMGNCASTFNQLCKSAFPFSAIPFSARLSPPPCIAKD